MIRPTMAVAAQGAGRSDRARQAHEARFPRLVALMLDSIFVGILGGVATAIFGVTQLVSAASSGAVSYWTTQAEIPGIWAVAIWLVYYTSCEAMFSATPGKVLNGLVVVSADGRPLQLRGIVIRNLMRIIDVLPGMYLLGGFAVMFTTGSRRLGDMAAGTTVVFRQDAVEPGTARSAGRRARLIFMAFLVAILAFCAGFEYFQRPVLVIQGELNQPLVLKQAVETYSLGAPTRTLDTVTYPIAAQTATQVCSGTITLAWQGLQGWTVTGSRLDCLPS